MARPLTPQQIREAELPRSLRGFDVESTRGVLARAADALGAVMRERDDLRRRVEELTKETAQNPTDAERLGAVLLAAKRGADGLVARASDEAADIRAQAALQRDELLVRAQAQADALASEGAAAREALRHEDEELRRSISVHRHEFVAFLRAALAQLDGVGTVSPGVAAQAELDDELLAQVPVRAVAASDQSAESPGKDPEATA